MKILTAGDGTIVEVYSSGREMTIARYTVFQKYLAKSASIPEVIYLIERAKAFTNKGDEESTIIELDNALIRLNAVNGGVSTQSPTFAVLVAKIGEKVVSDVSDDGIARTIAELEKLDFTYAIIEDEVNSFKKKVDGEIEEMFPNFRKSIDDFLMINKMKMFIQLLGNSSIDFEDKEQLLQNIQDDITTFAEARNGITDVEKEFYNLCGIMEENGSSNPHEYNVIQFYGKLNYITEKVEREKQQQKDSDGQH